MTGDCHVRILWEPEGETPSGYPTFRIRMRHAYRDSLHI
jgi:hypothetical protein